MTTTNEAAPVGAGRILIGYTTAHVETEIDEGTARALAELQAQIDDDETTKAKIGRIMSSHIKGLKAERTKVVDAIGKGHGIAAVDVQVEADAGAGLAYLVDLKTGAIVSTRELTDEEAKQLQPDIFGEAPAPFDLRSTVRRPLAAVLAASVDELADTDTDTDTDDDDDDDDGDQVGIFDDHETSPGDGEPLAGELDPPGPVDEYGGPAPAAGEELSALEMEAGRDRSPPAPVDEEAAIREGLETVIGHLSKTASVGRRQRIMRQITRAQVGERLYALNGDAARPYQPTLNPGVLTVLRSQIDRLEEIEAQTRRARTASERPAAIAELKRWQTTRPYSQRDGWKAAIQRGIAELS